MKRIASLGVGLLLLGATAFAQQYAITTVAGGMQPPSSPYAVAVDARGSVYFTSDTRVLKVDAAGVLTCVASHLDYPHGIAVDDAGNVYVAETGANRIVKVSSRGLVSTVAGNGTMGYSGDGGPAIGASLHDPESVAVDGAGGLFIADLGNNRIRKVAAGMITTVAGTGDWSVPGTGDEGDGGPATSAKVDAPWGVAVDRAGNLYISENPRIRKVAPNGVITTLAEISVASGLAVDGAGNLYVAVPTKNVVRKVSSDGDVTTVAGNGSEGYSGDGGPAVAAQLHAPYGVAVDGAGNLWIADMYNMRIRKVAGDGVITTIHGQVYYFGDGGPATAAMLSSPSGVAVDGAGSLYIADSLNNAVRKVTADGIITTVVGNGQQGYSGDGGPAAGAQVNTPKGVAVDAAGNLYVADTGNNRIRRVAPDGAIVTVAGTGDGEIQGPEDVAVDAAGNLYVTDSGNNSVRKVTPDGTIVTVCSLNGTHGVALDGSGNLYVAYYWYGFRDVGAWHWRDYGEGGVAKVTPDGTVTVVPGTYVSGQGTMAGDVPLYGPAGVAADGAGNLYVSYTGYFEGYHEQILKLAPDGTITTAAGTGECGDSGDGGPATSATLCRPKGLAVDAAGSVYIADSGNYSIRVLVPLGTHPLLGITMTHAGNFAQGQAGAAYSVVVSNAAGAAATRGTVTMTEIVPGGLTVVSMSGAGWACTANTCSRDDALDPGAQYPPITVMVDVAADALFQVTNRVSVSGGGSTPAGASDPTDILEPPVAPTLASPASGATGIVLAPALAWNTSAGAVSYDVYFGTSSPPLLVATTAAAHYAPGTLSQQTTYYWQIVARNGAGAASSAVWSFTTGAPSEDLRFIPVTPCRVVDTRRPDGPFGGPHLGSAWIFTRSFPIPQSGCGIPASAKAYSLNVTVVPYEPLSYLTLWPAGQLQPTVSTLNSWTGIVVANAAIVPAGTEGAVNVYATGFTNLILDIDGYFDASSGADSYAFYPLTPCRVADTRGPAGTFGAPPMHAAESRDFPIPLGACATPATASAFSLNVTVVPDPATGYLSYLTAWPAGSPRPNVSTLNSWTGKVVANAALVRVGTNESISVYATDPTSLILDINGYFGQPGGAGALSFHPVTPCRVADTRWDPGPFGGPEMQAGTIRSFPIPASGCNIPSTAEAYSMNVTVVPDGYLGYLSAWRTGLAQPTVSTLNSWDGTVVANAAIVPAGMDGAVSIYVANPTHVILDINGYFAP